jgi:beta-glucosidase
LRISPPASISSTPFLDTLFTVSVDITNTGSVFGKEVAQLYIVNSDGLKQLRGFTKVSLQAGETKTAVFEVTRRDVSYWDVGKQEWKVKGGSYRVEVGASSRNVGARGEVTL